MKMFRCCAGPVVVCVLAGSLYVLGAHSAVPARGDEPEAAKTSGKWEYCTLSGDHKGACTWNTGATGMDAESWRELAVKMKAPMPDEKLTDRSHRTAVMNFLGGQGWELVGESSVVSGESFVETFTFKRKL
jgi:hypothetical protein